MDRFTSESLCLKCTSNELICSAFQDGLQKGPLYAELCRYPPTSAQDMCKVVKMFEIANKMMRKKATREGECRRGFKPWFQALPLGRTKVFDRINHGRVEPRPSKRGFTHLTKMRMEYLMLHQNMLRPPAQLQGPLGKRDCNRGYDFHQNHGHETESCKELI